MRKMGIEFRILDFLQGMRTPVGDAVMCFITKLGDAGMIWIVLAVILLLIPKTRKTGIVMMAALCIDLVVCNGILKKLWKPALTLACLIAFSRLYLYVHYPTDILGGILVGIAAEYAGHIIIRRRNETKDS